ncbi:triacylglycerol lipase [Mechercharimyces sp. CAU 1602]|uniref:esterase/lipase family protein n=1 Tax=Mechercharimyces sp. CAU 1602 TaxID=2973933 RepID=UPI002163F1B3|nr:lipase [Mechercharimyces sp. CAU 1602]MCS1352077.1 lipase [Mechercharimyces sp. CAU 1602]
MNYTTSFRIFFSFTLVITLLLYPLGNTAWAAPTSDPALSTAERSEQKILPSIEIEPVSSKKENNYPIVLVHGFVGFDELLGIEYWGGLTDYERDLRKRGHEVYTAEIGPVTSNWDRAAELYAQIKGGTVDYGKAHAAQHGHHRFGRSYSGLYPAWGDIDPETGSINKIHLIGHSMGGQTIRTLIQLLENGHENESASTSGGDLSPLFDSTPQPWVHGVVTISSPHDGTTFTGFVDEVLPQAQKLLAGFGTLTGGKKKAELDLQLDQWGLKRERGESFHDYIQRAKKSKVWKTSDQSKWDLSPNGAKELNQWVNASPNVYYFSIANEQTRSSLFNRKQRPELLMNPLFYAGSIHMGRYRGNENGITINADWWQNDGIVNTNSMDGPTIGSNDQIVHYDGTPQRGKWNYMGKMKSFDHFDIVGAGVRDLRSWYRDLATMLSSLPE